MKIMDCISILNTYAYIGIINANLRFLVSESSQIRNKCIRKQNEMIELFGKHLIGAINFSMVILLVNVKNYNTCTNFYFSSRNLPYKSIQTYSLYNTSFYICMEL